MQTKQRTYFWLISSSQYGKFARGAKGEKQKDSTLVGALPFVFESSQPSPIGQVPLAGPPKREKIGTIGSFERPGQEDLEWLYSRRDSWACWAAKKNPKSFIGNILGFFHPAIAGVMSGPAIQAVWEWQTECRAKRTKKLKNRLFVLPCLLDSPQWPRRVDWRGWVWSPLPDPIYRLQNRLDRIKAGIKYGGRRNLRNVTG